MGMGMGPWGCMLAAKKFDQVENSAVKCNKYEMYYGPGRECMQQL